ncbi:MAG: DUF1697 domain-containing protein [Micropruina sp.]
MSRRILLIRAVNVGGTGTLPMAQWRGLAESLGARDVSTYIASGNMVCTPPDDGDAFERALETAVEQQYGFFREVISRSREEMIAALEAYPFEIVEPKFSYISFLAGAPSRAAIAKAGEAETGDDRWQVIGTELHLRFANGAGRSELNQTALGQALGVAGTARNLNTVRKLIELAR